MSGRPRRTNKPDLVLEDIGFEQRFSANVVHVEDSLLAFGDLVPDEGNPSNAGHRCTA